MVVLTNQNEKDKLNGLVEKFGRDAVNKSIKENGQENFASALNSASDNIATENVQITENTPKGPSEDNLIIPGVTGPKTKTNVLESKKTPVSTLSDTQKEAIKTKSEGMTIDEKKAFREQLKTAQTNDAKKVAKSNADKINELGNITNIEQFKAAGGTLDNLSSLIQNAYGSEGEVIVKNGAIYGKKNGRDTKWIIDDAGNPIATTISKDEARSEGVDLGFNMSQGAVLDKLFNNTGEGLDDTTEEWKAAKQQFDNFNKQDKTENGFYRSMKDGTFDVSLTAQYNKTPQFKVAMDAANKRFVKDKADNMTVKELLALDAGGLREWVKVNLGEFGLNIDFQKQIDDNENIQTYKDGYLEANKTYLSKQAELKTLKDKIKQRYPNAAPDFINAIYQSEAGAIIDEANAALTSAGAYKGSYDLEMGELKSVNDLQIKQSDKQLNAFSSLFDKQVGLEILQEESNIKEEFNKAFQKSNKKLIQKTDKNGDLVFFDNEGNEVKRFEGFSDSGTSGDNWKYKSTDNGWVGVQYNNNTGTLKTKSYNKDGDLIRTYGNFGNIAISEGISSNLPDINNNPFNVKNSPLAKKLLGYEPKVDKQGHIIFNSPEDGLKVGLGDIQAKLDGKTTNKNILEGIKNDGYVSLSTLGKGWATDPAWAIGVASILGVNVFTNANNIDKTELAKAIAKQEGYSGAIKLSNAINNKGNDKFLKIKPKDYTSLSSLNLGLSTISKIEELINVTDTSKFRALSRKIGSFFPEFSVSEQDANFDKLSALTIDTLASYVKSISGATVSDKERENLEKVLPTPSDNNTTFKIKLETFKRKMNEVLGTEAKYWGFKDIDTMQEALGIHLNTSKGTVYNIN